MGPSGKDRLFSREILTVECASLGVPGYVKIGYRRFGRAKPGFATHHHPGVLEICYLASGRQVLAGGDRARELRAHDLFITPPGLGHSSAGEPTDRCFLYYIQFDLEARPFLHFDVREVAELRRALLDDQDLWVHGHEGIGALLEQILVVSSRQQPFRRARLSSLLADFLVALVACRKPAQRLSKPLRLRDAMAYIDDHVEEAIPVAELAERCGLSPARLEALFVRETGYTPKDYILREKISRARAFLEKGTEPVTALAARLGFSSSQYFATVFKRYVSVTPQAYRKSHQPGSSAGN